jgi:argininosuccinate lyase
MTHKLWEKNGRTNQAVERFTVGNDREMDLYLAKYDVLGSMAHITMLESAGLLTGEELAALIDALKAIYAQADRGLFTIEENVEDVHSQVELMLTRQLGDTGKKIHSGRSRNDQVLLDLKLFTRAQIQELVLLTSALFDVLIDQSNRYREVLLPGYTHLQIAMPSSFGLWFGAYAESLTDDLLLMQAAYRICNRNPLGSAAGYGSSFPLNRTMTTELLGFDSLNYNVVYAQMGRGKMERTVAFAMAGLAATLSKLAMDACLFNSQNFAFIRLPDSYTTGSSIMPHKKNPDVFELTRAKCNKIQGLPQQITLIANNLPSGYFRDLQIIKEIFLPSFDELKDCLRMVTQMMQEVEINEHILDDAKYALIFSVEEVNRLVLAGMPFRDAYRQVGLEIEAGKFTAAGKAIHHTHEGSIGNLCNEQIASLKQQIISSFGFEAVNRAERNLLAGQTNHTDT